MAKNDNKNEHRDQGTPALAGVDRADATEELGERPGPVPNLDESRVRQPQAAAEELPTRQDTRPVQGTPQFTPRTVVMEPAPPPQDDTTAITAPAPLGTHNLGAGGLSEAARLWYGDETKAGEIFEANRDRMTDPDTYVIGMPIRIPKLDK